MRRDSLKKLYVIHSWVGVITGILLFIICFSGAISVFGPPELKLWSNENLHQSIEHSPEAIDQLIERYGADIAADYQHEVLVFLPGPYAFNNLHLLFLTEHGPDERIIEFTFKPHDLGLIRRIEGSPEEIFAARKTTLESFITEFHANLHMGRIGLILTGLLGLTLMASITTGLFIHRKILKELFSFRPFRSLRLLLTDSHKVLSVWGILFHSMISFTGAFLGLVTVIMLPAAAFVSFQGDQEKLLETFQPAPPTLSGEASDMRIDKVLEYSWGLGEIPRSITIQGWGDKNALATTSALSPQSMAPKAHRHQLQDGKLLQSTTAYEAVGGASGPILDLMFPLHFGNFGGLPVRIIWSLLGLSTALVAVSGVMIWVERRAYGAEGKLPAATYLRLSKLTIGSCTGMVVAFAALFWGQRLAPGYIVETFFASWLVCLIYAASRRNNYQSNRQLLATSGLLLTVVPLLDALTLKQAVFSNMTGAYSQLALIDLALCMIGLLLVYCSYLLPAKRPVQQHKNQHKSAMVSSDSTVPANQNPAAVN